MTENEDIQLSDQLGLGKDAEISLEQAFIGKIWNVVRKTFNFQDEVLVREFIAHRGAVAVLALNEKDEVLLIKQYRAPVNEYLYEMPAGLRDHDGEDDLVAAKRELAEETDYQATDWSHLHSFYTTPGSSSELIEIFLARGLSKTEVEFERTGEEKGMVPIWVPFEKVLKAVSSSKLKSPTLVVAVLSLAAQRNQNG
ncbi:MAG: NUDIX domain-containing protein, partial [Actinobacteria bacterium]|nr:NUDIX domain-containing protein [Actinomycetota bacterium]